MFTFLLVLVSTAFFWVTALSHIVLVTDICHQYHTNKLLCTVYSRHVTREGLHDVPRYVLRIICAFMFE